MLASLFLVALAAVYAAVLWRLLRGTAIADVEAFARVYDVRLTAANADLLKRTLQRGRHFRTAGGVAALIAGVIWLGNPSGWMIFGYVAVGYAGGSLADELTRPRPSGAGQRASLERRTVRTFVASWVVGLVAIAAIAAAVQVAASLRLTPGGGWFVYAPNSTPNLPHPIPDQRAIITWAVLGGAAVIAGIVALRRVAQAPTVVDEPDRAAVRHATRTASVLSIGGAMMMSLGIVAVRLGSATTLHDGADEQWVQVVHNASYFAGLLATFVGANLSLRAFPRRWRLTAGPSPAPAEPT